MRVGPNLLKCEDTLETIWVLGPFLFFKICLPEVL